MLTARQLRLSFAGVLVVALQLRVPMFLAEPTLSDDVWRYLHDGRAQNAGVNPYLYAPDDPRTAQYRGPEHKLINHRQLPTIYPPVAQYAFRIAASSSRPILVWRLMLLAAEIAILIAGALLLKRCGLPAANLALYAWHPLAIFEGIGSAHLEPLAIASLVLAAWWAARGSWARSGFALALSVGAKLVAAPLLLLIARRPGATLMFALALAALYLPFAGAGANVLGSLSTFGETWESNGSIYALATELMDGRTYRIVAGVGVLALVGIMALRRIDFASAAFAFFFTVFLLSPVVHPWYLLWLIVFLPFRRQPFDVPGSAALLWSTAVVFSYEAQHQQVISGAWQIPRRFLLAEYVPVYLLLIMAATALVFSQIKLMPISRKNAAKI